MKRRSGQLLHGVTFAAALGVTGVVGALEIDFREVKGPDLWGGRAAHPAVVNTVVGQDPARVVSLRGEWEFMQRGEFGRNNAWVRHAWMTDPNPWARKIQVPGCWEAQGVGEPGESWCWNVVGDNNAKPVRHKFMGVGCYRKSVKIPAEWKGLRIWLKVGGAKSVGWFSVNTHPVACVDSFCGTYKYDITDLVTAGETATVVAQVRNDVPSRKGILSAMHRWGGLYRDVELEATPATFIDDAWFRGDFDKRLAEAHVEVKGLKGARTGEHVVRVTVEDQVVERTLEPSATPDDLTIAFPLKNFRAWSPEHPNLYTGVVELVEKGRVVQTRRERFGIRKLEVRGKEFLLNNRPFFFRGFGDDHVYPMTGITPADVNVHRAHLAKARAAGFNYVRLHTHTEVPEYFEAADELGIIVEPELPYYNDEPTEGQVFDPVRDVTELWRHYRRHPSFGIYSMGNEGTFGPDLDRALHRYVRQMDPDRLKINQDCHVPEINPAYSADFVGGPISIWPRGSFNPERPFVTHEYMNLGAKQDSRLEPRYTGAWQPPVPRAKRGAWLATFGLDHVWGDRLQDAQHVLQRTWQKLGIECARTDPHCDGFCFWTIADVVVAYDGTYSAQGLFNPFWEQKKGGFDAADVNVFNRAEGVFADLPSNGKVFAAGDTLATDILFSNYGEGTVRGASVAWTLSAGGRTLAEGVLPAGDLAVGGVRKIAALGTTVPAVERATRATLRLDVASTHNTYDLWLFPSRAVQDGAKIAVADAFRPALETRYAGLLPSARAAEAEIVIAPYGSRFAAAALARGQKVITLNRWNGAANVQLGWWAMGSQVGTAFLDHPAFARLPHQGALNELFFRIVKKGLQLPFAGLAQEDLLAVGEGGAACYLYLGQGRVGTGRVLMSFGLDVVSGTPEGAALLDGMIDYVRSAAFAPKSAIEMPVAKELNGWAKTLAAGDRSTWPGPTGDMKLVVARGTAGMTELAWETCPAPADIAARKTFDFTFFGGQGFVMEPPVSFQLFVNGEKALDIPEVTLQSHTWKGNGYTLAYVREESTQEYGVYTLTVPSGTLTAGKPAVIRVVAKPNDSRRWFCVSEQVEME